MGALTCTWADSDGVEVENHPLRSASVKGNFPAREVRTVSYTLSHPRYLFGQREYSQTVRFCPRPPDPGPGGDDPPDPAWFDDGDDGDSDDEGYDGHWCCYWGTCDGSCGCGNPECCDGAGGEDFGDFDGTCPVHGVAYDACADLHRADYTNAMCATHLDGVLYIRNPPRYEQLWLEVPVSHHNCCPCPEHRLDYVSVAYKSYRLGLVDAAGAPFVRSGESCTVNLAGLHPSSEVGDADLAFVRNGELYQIHHRTVLGVGIEGNGVDLPLLNAASPRFGAPMTICTNEYDALRLKLSTRVMLPTGNIHLELANATGRFTVWYRDRWTWELRVLLDSRTTPVKDLPLEYWREMMRRTVTGSTAEMPIYVTSTSTGRVDLVFRYWDVAGGRFVQDEAVQRITSVGPPLLPDHNRDGCIDDNDLPFVFSQRVLRHWTNEDTVKGDYVGHNNDRSANASDLEVNGRYDLVNLFPLKLDLKPFVDAWGSRASFSISAQDGCLRFCGADVQPQNSGDIWSTDSYTTTGDPLSCATLVPVTGEGVEIAPANYLGNGMEPGTLAFEAAQSLVGFMEMRVELGGAEAFRYRLPLSILPVDSMFRWKGLRGVCGGESSVFDRTGTPLNLPDSEVSDSNLLFVHGFHVNELDARDWARTIFKRFWLSGMDARFHAVTWEGSEGVVADGGLNYHKNVCNAFATAEAFAQYVGGLLGSKYIVAHSLGNMLVASAIKEHSMPYDGFFMCNAAIPSESFEPSLFDASTDNPLVHDDWKAYPPRTWASCWHMLPFPVGDDRSSLTWKGYFSSLAASPKVYNFYSSGDEVYELCDSTPGAVGGFASSTARYSWHKQESFKGRMVSNDPLSRLSATDFCGWGFRSTIVENGVTGANTYFRIHSVNDAASIDDVGLMTTNTVFNPSPTAMFATNIPAEVRHQILAKGIPALSIATGRDCALPVHGQNHNVDINIDLKLHRWGRLGRPYDDRWLHSDINDMSYIYVQELFTGILELVE